MFAALIASFLHWVLGRWSTDCKWRSGYIGLLILSDLCHGGHYLAMGLASWSVPLRARSSWAFLMLEVAARPIAKHHSRIDICMLSETKQTENTCKPIKTKQNNASRSRVLRVSQIANNKKGKKVITIHDWNLGRSARLTENNLFVCVITITINEQQIRQTCRHDHD